MKWSLGGPLSKLCVTPPFSINFRCQIENQVSDYRILGASRFIFVFCFCFCIVQWKNYYVNQLYTVIFYWLYCSLWASWLTIKHLFVCTWLSSLVAWCKHFNTKWPGYASFIGQTSALGEMFQSTCVPHVNKISILIYTWVITCSIVVTQFPCYKLKLNVLLFTQRVYVAMLLDILDVNRL